MEGRRTRSGRSIEYSEKQTTQKRKKASKIEKEETIEENEQESCSTSESQECSDIGSLKRRSDEFDALKNWILESAKNKTALSIYISGQPGTGKTATTKRVIESLGRKTRHCLVNCASVNTKSSLMSTIFKSENIKGRASEELLKEHTGKISTPLILVLDEIDHLVSRNNSTLYSAFQWPYKLSSKIIIIGIANSIDLTERLLPKLMLAEPPKRLVFEPYSKNDIIEILTDKMKNEGNEIDEKAVELCARKVAAMSGDLRTALHVFKQTKHRINSADSKIGTNNGCREVLGVINSVYSSPLARARLPFQPRILLAVSLVLSSSKKTSFTRDSLMNAYFKACDAIRAPQMDDEDLQVAFQTLESQSFIQQLNGGKLVLQVDAATAKSAISDNSMLDQISVLNL